MSERAPMLQHVGCSACGSTLGIREGQRTARCTHCDSLSLVLLPNYIPRFRVQPKLGAPEAVSAARAGLGGEYVKRGLITTATFEPPELYYVPFYEVDGISATSIVEDTTLHKDQYGVTKESSQSQRIAMADYQASGPAVALEDWGIDAIKVRTRRSQLGLQLQSFEPTEIAKEAYTFPPSPVPDQALSPPNVIGGRSDARQLGAELIAPEVRYVYYPIWRVTYRDGHHPYVLSIDGVTGDVLGGRAPEDRRRGMIYMLLAEAMLALALGKVIALLTSGRAGEFFLMLAAEPAILAAILMLLLGLLFPVVLFWAEFRFPGEVLFRGSEITVEKLGAPATTAVEKAFLRVAEVIGSVSDAMVRSSMRRH